MTNWTNLESHAFDFEYQTVPSKTVINSWREFLDCKRDTVYGYYGRYDLRGFEDVKPHVVFRHWLIDNCGVAFNEYNCNICGIIAAGTVLKHYGIERAKNSLNLIEYGTTSIGVRNAEDLSVFLMRFS